MDTNSQQQPNETAVTRPAKDQKLAPKEQARQWIAKAQFARARARGFAQIWVGVERDTLVNYGPTAKFTESKEPIKSYDRKLAKIEGRPRKFGRRVKARILAMLTKEAQELGLYEAPEQDEAA